MPPAAAAGEGGEGQAVAGQGGIGGAAGGGLPCEPGFEDCDESTINGCEAKLAVDPWHCGACGQSCEGVCSRGNCRPLDYASSEPVTGTSPIIGVDHVYFVASPLFGDGEHSLQRVSKKTLVIDALLEHNQSNRLEKLGLGLDRLYFVNGSDLFSIGFSGLGLHDERLKPGAFAEVGAWLYWSSEGELSRRPAREDAGLVETQALVSNAALLVGHPAGLLVAFSDESTSPASYEIASLREWPVLTSVAHGVGRLVRLRQTPLGTYFLVATEAEGEPSMQLHHVSTSWGAPRLVAAAPDIVDFAVDARAPLIYLTYTTLTRSGVRVLSEELGLRLEVGTKYEPTQVEYDSGRLWFTYPGDADPSQRFLVRVATASLFE